MHASAAEILSVLREVDLRPHIDPIIRRTIPVCQDALRCAGLSPHQVDEIVLVGGTTRLPLVRSIVEETFGKKPQTAINPMSVVVVRAERFYYGHMPRVIWDSGLGNG